MSNDERLDREIDAAARSLVRGEPAPGFARRVTTRIEASSARPWLPAWQVAAAVALVVLILYAAPWSGRPRPDAPESPPQAAHLTPPVPRVPVESAAEPAGPMTVRSTPVPRSASPAIAARITIDDAALTLAPLSEPRDLSVPIEEPADLTVPPLEIAELTLPPLVPGEKEPR